MSETDEWNGEKTGFSVLDINLIRRRRKEPYHRDLTKGGRTLGRHVELLVSGRLRGFRRLHHRDPRRVSATGFDGGRAG